MLSLKYRYFVSSFIANFCNSIEYTISMHSMLSVVQANPLTSAMSVYISKDVIGQIFGSLYTYKNSQKPNMNRALFFQQSSLSIEVVTPLISVSFFPYIICGSNLLKTIAFMQLGSINSKALYKLTSIDNHAETYNHLSILNTAASSLGICSGLAITQYITNPLGLLSIISGLSIVKIISYRYGIKSVLGE